MPYSQRARVCRYGRRHLVRVRVRARARVRVRVGVRVRVWVRVGVRVRVGDRVRVLGEKLTSADSAQRSGRSTTH